MNECKLKNNIIKKASLGGSSQGLEYIEILENDLDNIINEVKKDYPTHSTVYQKAIKHGINGESILEWVEHNLKLEREYWFKKWFGEWIKQEILSKDIGNTSELRL
jgi:hypothetical protein